jgi:hypothetical protein
MQKVPDDPNVVTLPVTLVTTLTLKNGKPVQTQASL